MLSYILSKSMRCTSIYFRVNASRRASQDSNKNSTHSINTFRPSLDAVGEASISKSKVINSKKKINIDEVIAERKRDERKNLKKVRKLNKFDKWILVKLGKFARVEDVPDQIVYQDAKATEAAKQAVQAELTEKGFKFFMFADYTLWILCVAFCGPIFYYYYYHHYLPNEKSPPTRET